MDEEKDITQQSRNKWMNMREEWMRHVVNSDMTLAARVVGLHLALRMSYRSKTSFPHIKTMARDMGISARHAQRGMLELEKRELIYVTRTLYEGNRYNLRMPYD